jgi:hypothetical protein
MDEIDAREAWSSKAASLDVDSPQSRNHFDRTLLKLLSNISSGITSQFFLAKKSYVIFFAMKLDTKHLRYLTNEDWRVLTAVRLAPSTPLHLD